MHDLQLIKRIDEFYKLSYIRKFKNKYRVYSKKGKNLGTFDSLEDAKKRLKQIEYFKHKKASKEIDISEADAFTYSSIIRLLRKKLNDNDLNKFLKTYRALFEKNYLDGLDSLEKNTLLQTLFELKEDLNLKVDIKKNAGLEELGTPSEVGKYLANIVKFTMQRIKNENRPVAMLKLKKKIYFLNENEIARKKMPASSAMGSSLTFIKHTLFNQNASYIREVLNNIVKNI